MKLPFILRSPMFVPAHNVKLLESAVHREADALLLDVEDSVPDVYKQQARENIIRYAQRGDLGGKLLFPRVNDRESGELLKDAYQLTVNGIAGFVYPKANKAEDVYFFGKLLETIEYEKGVPIGSFKIIPLIETTGAIVDISHICQACSRVIAVAFGCEDYVTDLCGKHDEAGHSIFVARSMIAIAARAAGIIPIDTVHIKVHDLADLEKNLILSKNLGFEGMLVLNPRELSLVNQYFTPTQDELSWAELILQASADAISEGKGVSLSKGQFIGPPMVKMAQRIVDRYQAIKEKKQ
jgi:citrate lyase subunit beta/citryl-CoA lyase